MGGGDYFRGEKAPCSEAGYSIPCSAAAKNEKLWLARGRFPVSFTCQHSIVCLLTEVYGTGLWERTVSIYIISDYVLNSSNYISSKDKKNNELSRTWEEAALA